MKKIFVAMIAAFMLFTTVSINTVKAEEESNAPVVEGLYVDRNDDGQYVFMYDEQDGPHQYPGNGYNYFIDVNEKDYTVNVVLNNFKVKFYGLIGIVVANGIRPRPEYAEQNREKYKVNINITLVGNNTIKYVENSEMLHLHDVVGIGSRGFFANQDESDRIIHNLMNINLLGDGTLNIDLSESHALRNIGMNFGSGMSYANVNIAGPIINLNLKTESIGIRKDNKFMQAEGEGSRASANIGIMYGNLNLAGGAININLFENRALVTGLCDAGDSVDGSLNIPYYEDYATQTNINGIVNIIATKPSEKSDRASAVGGITILNGTYNQLGGSVNISLDNYVYDGALFGISAGVFTALLNTYYSKKTDAVAAATATDGQVLLKLAGEAIDVDAEAPVAAQAAPKDILGDFYDEDEMPVGKINIAGGDLLINLNETIPFEKISDTFYAGVAGTNKVDFKRIESRSTPGIHTVKQEFLVPGGDGAYVYYLADILGNPLTQVAIANNGGGGDTPSKKEGTCEEVHGPTWHWNNDKKVCENVGVVNTFTR